MTINLWPGYWKTKLKSMNMKVDDNNGKATGIGNGRYRKFRQFSGNEFWKSIGCLVSDHNFGIGISRLCEKEEEKI